MERETAVSRRDECMRLLTQGGSGGFDALLPIVYEELRELAGAYLRRERAAHTLQPTALAHEAYLRLVDATKIEWRDRAQLLAIAARAMRQILIDHARRRAALKRGGGRDRVTLSDTPGILGDDPLDLLELDAALEDLAAVDPRKGRVVELRFFAGLTLKEVAEAVGISLTTAEDDWYFARAWLRGRLA